MVSCSAVYCSNVPKKGYRFFRFPSNAERRAQWVKRVNKEDWTPKHGSRLCEVHFEESQFEQHREDNARKLKPNAIPTIFKGSFAPRKRKSKKNVEEDNVFQPDIVISECRTTLKRCCFCFIETYPSDGILLVLNGELTQFGLTVKILLMVSSAEMSTDYCCSECSSEVLLSFEKMMALNVSAYLTCRKISTKQNLDEILRSGCEICGEINEKIGQYTDHFRSHVLEKTTDCEEVQPEPIIEEPIIKEDIAVSVGENENKLSPIAEKEDRLLSDHCYAKESKEKHCSLVCHICGSRLKNKKSYSKHLWLHTKKPDLNHWTIDSNRKLHKKRHINVEKMDNSLLGCEQCDARFTHRSLLVYHYYLMHNSFIPENACKRRRPWSCSLCEKIFPSFRTLRNHAKEDHRGRDVVPFRCEVCQRGYCSLKSLKSHLTIKHVEGKEPPHGCPYCPRRYFREINLLNHITMVHPFSDEQINNSNLIEEVIATTNSDMQYNSVQFDVIPGDAKDWIIIDEGFVH